MVNDFSYIPTVTFIIFGLSTMSLFEKFVDINKFYYLTLLGLLFKKFLDKINTFSLTEFVVKPV